MPRKTKQGGSSASGSRAAAEAAGTLKIETLTGDVVSGLFTPSENAFALFVLAHGAGAGMRHPFMDAVAERLAQRGIATLRYQFPYMESKRQAPDRPPVLIGTVRGAVRKARELANGLPIFAGGKSMGGRMTSTAAAEAGWRAEPGGAHDQEDVERAVHGIAFLGFPLHPPGKPSAERAAHLADVRVPLLFLQGTRDSFAAMELLRPVLTSLGPRATLHIVDTADHGFHVLKSSGKTDAGVLDELAEEIAKWMRQVLGTGGA
jgi:predicted alpha/beta-hydrolase family hydrolase